HGQQGDDARTGAEPARPRQAAGEGAAFRDAGDETPAAHADAAQLDARDVGRSEDGAHATRSTTGRVTRARSATTAMRSAAARSQVKWRARRRAAADMVRQRSGSSSSWM